MESEDKWRWSVVGGTETTTCTGRRVRIRRLVMVRLVRNGEVEDVIMVSGRVWRLGKRIIKAKKKILKRTRRELNDADRVATEKIKMRQIMNIHSVDITVNEKE